MEQSPSPESFPVLAYAAGWRTLETDPSAADYLLWLDQLTDATVEAVGGSEEVPWATDRNVIRCRWQRAIELVSDALGNQGAEGGEDAMLETALLTLVEEIEWREVGLTFSTPFLLGEAREPSALIDLRDLPDAPSDDIEP
jgi:hypothetical protein